MSLVISCAQSLTNQSHLRSLEVEDRVSETQLQVTENYNLIDQNLNIVAYSNVPCIERVKVKSVSLFKSVRYLIRYACVGTSSHLILFTA